MCDHYHYYCCCCYIMTCRQSCNNVGYESSTRYYNDGIMKDRYGITFSIVCRTKKIMFMEEDWLKDLQGDVYRVCIYVSVGKPAINVYIYSM